MVIKVRNSLKILKKGGFCDMISTVKKEITMSKELHSKIEWVFDLLIDTISAWKLNTKNHVFSII